MPCTKLELSLCLCVNRRRCLSDFTFLGSRCWNRSRWVQGYWEVTPGTGLTSLSPARGGARNKACGFEDPLTGQKWPGSCATPLPSQRPRAVDKSKPWAQTLTWILKKLQLEAVSQLPPPSRQLGPSPFSIRICDMFCKMTLFWMFCGIQTLIFVLN